MCIFSRRFQNIPILDILLNIRSREFCLQAYSLIKSAAKYNTVLLISKVLLSAESLICFKFCRQFNMTHLTHNTWLIRDSNEWMDYISIFQRLDWMICRELMARPGSTVQRQLGEQ